MPQPDGSPSAIEVAAAAQAAAALLNLLIVVWLVRVTKRYADETADIATGTRDAASAAQRSAEAAERAAQIAERQVLESHRPYLLVTHVGVSPYVEAAHRQRGRDRAVPIGFSINVQNEGLGPVTWLSAALSVSGVAFTCDYKNVPNRRLPAGTAAVTLRFEAAEEALETLFKTQEISGELRFAYADALGNGWLQLCPVTVHEDHSSASVGQCSVARLAEP